MAEMSLGDFFSQKKKPKKMGSNLNNAAAAKAEPKKKKDEGEDGWEEQEATAASLKVEIAGKLTRDEDKKDEEGGTRAAWGNTKTKTNADLNERKFPSLAKSVQSSNITLHEEKKLNIETAKNLFSALEGDDDDDEDGPKKPSHIKPAMVTKKKGEFEKAAIQREVEKYKGPAADKKGSKKKAKDEEDDDDDDDEEEVEAVETKKKTKKIAPLIPKEKPQEEQQELAEDAKIVPDLAAAKAKYEGRRKLEVVPLPRSELEEEKENRPAAKNAPAAAGKKGKKKGGYVDEEEMYTKKLMVLEDPDADF